MRKLLVSVQLVEVDANKKVRIITESAVLEDLDSAEMHKNRNALDYMADKAVNVFLAQFERPTGR